MKSLKKEKSTGSDVSLKFSTLSKISPFIINLEKTQEVKYGQSVCVFLITIVS